MSSKTITSNIGSYLIGSDNFTLANYATIGGAGVTVGIKATGTNDVIVNGGDVYAGLYAFNNYGIFINTGGSITNLSGGTITAAFRGIEFNGTGSLTNYAGALVSGNRGIDARGFVTITNYGTIETIGTTDYGVELFGGGLLSNQSTGIITGYRGIDAGGNNATIVNAGSIAGLAGGRGIELGGSNSSVTNLTSGVITGYRGIDAGGNNATIVNAGSIAGLAGGRGIELGGSNSSVTNLPGGVITGYRGIDAGGSYATIVNAGSLVGTASGRGINFGGGGSVTNMAGGIITGSRGINTFGNNTTIVNAGTIGSPGNEDYGIELAKGGLLTNQSTGVIYGSTGVHGGFLGGATTVVNAGSISGASGAVKLNAGYSNLVVVDPGGSFSGTVDGGNSIGSTIVSTLELASGGVGALSGLGTEFIHFANIVVDSGASWVLSGSNSLTSGTTLTNSGSLTNSGTLQGAGVVNGPVAGSGVFLASGGTLDLTSATTLSGIAGLQIGGGATLRLDGSVAAGDVVTFNSSATNTKLDLTGTTITGNQLNGFAATIVGLNPGLSLTTPTNEIDLANFAPASILSASVNTSTDVLTVVTTSGTFALTLSASFTTPIGVGVASDGGSGTDLFLSEIPAGSPVISVPGAESIVVGVAASISGVRVTEAGNLPGETFTVMLSDTAGTLKVTKSGSAAISGNSSTSVTISGSLTDVNNTLATLSDTDGTAGGDTITVSASDSYGNAAAMNGTIAVTAIALMPVISVPGAQTIAVSTATPISGVSVSEPGNFPGETFTAKLSDTIGALKVTKSGSASISGNSSTNVTISGSLTDVDNTLATLSDTDGTLGSDTITVSASDSFGHSATNGTIAVTVTNGPPVITVPGARTAGVGKALPISGISISETGNTTGETFTVVLGAMSGALTLTKSGSALIGGNGSTSVTVSGSLTDVKNTLATLSDLEGTAGSDTITVNASDSDGSTATSQSLAVTVNGLPVIAVPGPQSVTIYNGTSIPGISISESGSTTSGETFTAVVSDSNGSLSAFGSAGASGEFTTRLTISGSLTNVNNTLAALSDNDGTAGSDTITVSATDSFGNAAATNGTIAVTAHNGPPTILVPATTEVIGIGAVAPVALVSIVVPGNPAGETFSVTLSDTNGALSLTKSGAASISGNSSTSVTVDGSLTDVDNTLATLTDTDSIAGPDTINVTAMDSFGQSAVGQTFGVNAIPNTNGPLMLTVPGSYTARYNSSYVYVSGIRIAESGDTTDELFKVELSDPKRTLSVYAYNYYGPTVLNNYSNDVTIIGSITNFNSVLSTLKAGYGPAGTDTITVTAIDSLGGTQTGTIDISENSGPGITLPGPQTVTAGKATPIAGVGITELGNTTGETFTVSLNDSTGTLAVTQSGSDSVYTYYGYARISGSLTDVNNSLAMLMDTETAAGSNAISISVYDRFGYGSSSVLEITAVPPSPGITVPGAQTMGVGKPAPVAGVAISESYNTPGETFTAVVSDINGALSVTQSGSAVIGGNNSTSVTVSGSLTDVDNTLATLSDTDGTTGSDTITVSAADSYGNAAPTNGTIAITVNGLPSIAASATATILQGALTTISGVGLSETGNTSGENFSVTLVAGTGMLSTSNAGGATVSGSGTGSLTISGGLAAVTTALANLDDTDATSGSDTITLNATDGFGNVAAQEKIAVTVTPSGLTFTLTTGKDSFTGGTGNDMFNAATNTLSAGDQIDGGGGTNDLNLIGAGIFNLTQPATLANIQVVNAQEGQAASGSIPATNQTVTLRGGLNVTVDVTAATINPLNPKPATITITGGNDSSTINLASGNDTVTVGSAGETIHGGSGNDQIQVTPTTIGATIDGGTGSSTLILLGSAATITMSANITRITEVELSHGSAAMSFIANATAGMTVDDLNTTYANTVTAGALSQILTGGGNGKDTFVGYSGGSTTFKDASSVMSGDTLKNFFAGNDVIDLTDMSPTMVQPPTFSGGKLTVKDGTHTATLTLPGTVPAGSFHTAADSGSGTLITFY